MKKEDTSKLIDKTYFIYFISMFLFVVVRILVAERLINFGDNQIVEGVIFSVITQIILMFGLPLTLYCIMLKQKPKQVIKGANFKKIRVEIILISVVFGVVAFVFNIISSSFFAGLLNFFGYRSAAAPPLGNYSLINFAFDILLIAVLPAFCEEFLHRGLLLKTGEKLGYKKAIFLSSLLFGLVHLNIQQFFFASILGVFLAVITLATKNIWPAIIIHFLNNGIAVYLKGARAFGWVGGNLFESLSAMFAGMGAVLQVLVLLAGFMITIGLIVAIIYWFFKRTTLLDFQDKYYQVYGEKIKLTPKTVLQLDNNHPVLQFAEDYSDINLDYKNIGSIIDVVIPKQKSRIASSSIFITACIVLGLLVTIFTFIWGLL